MNTSDLRLKYVLVGASGSGKTTMAGILEEVFGFRRCITCTTRPLREGEVDGIDYYFCKNFNGKDMFEHAFFGDAEYGVTWDELTKGDFIILEPQGVQYFRDHYPSPLIVIQLKRDNIQVDADRMARDKAAGFDDVNPDIVVTGNCIADMATKLLGVISSLQQGTLSSLDDKIQAAEDRVKAGGSLSVFTDNYNKQEKPETIVR